MTLTKKRELKGIWAPIPTPLDENGVVDIATTKSLVDHLIESGIDGIFALGTSGEFAVLSAMERMRLSEAVIDAANDRVPVVIGISGTCVDDIVSFGKSIEDMGADAVMATPPYYYQVGQKGIIDFYAILADSFNLPLMVYNIPEWTHNFVEPDTVDLLAEQGLIKGMKYTENNLFRLLEFISKSGDKIQIFTGSDALALACLLHGGAGAIMSSANVMPDVASSIYDLYLSGKLGEAVQQQMKLLPVIEAVSVGYFPAGLKYAMKLLGLPVGQVKRPLERLEPSQEREVEKLLSGIIRERRQKFRLD
ncbi:MAG: 4-hydroxy-tetrahydrodipicolinate synthase [Conexivisphaerales archaeon]